MAIPGNVKDREFRKFTESPSGSDKVAVRTVISQSEGEALKVELGTRGIAKSIPNQISSVNETINALIVSYTVPIGKTFDLSKIICSGDNLSIYRVYIDGVLTYVKRSTWGNFNVDFDIVETIVSEGDKIEVFAENKGKGQSDYESTIIGGEYNND